MAREHQFNTPEQVRAYLTEALNIVNELDPPSDLRTACFIKATELTAQKQVFFEQASMSPMIDLSQPQGRG